MFKIESKSGFPRGSLSEDLSQGVAVLMVDFLGKVSQGFSFTNGRYSGDGGPGGSSCGDGHLGDSCLHKVHMGCRSSLS